MTTETKKTPTLRFPEFGGDWKDKKYGEIYSFRATNSFSRENLNYDNGEVKNIHYGDIHTKFKTLFDITNEYVPFINEDIELNKISEDNYCKIGDLVIADASEDYADVGKCIEIINLNGEKVLAGLHTFLARPDLYEMKSGFSGYLMQYKKVRLQIMTIAQGTKVLGLAKGRLEKIKLNIPESKEQEKISSFLTSIDKKIEQITKKKDLLEKYKKGVMQKIFNQEIRFKDENGENFADWEEKTLEKIAKFTKGNGISKLDIDKNGKYECIRYGELYTEYKETIVNIKSKTNLKKELLVFSEENDIIIPSSGETHIDIATASCVMKSGVALGGDLNILKTKDNGVFLAYYLNNKMKFEIASIAQGSSVIHLYSSQLKNLKLFMPSKAEQKKIADFLSAIDDKINLVNQELEKTQEYKKGLLQQMFI